MGPGPSAFSVKIVFIRTVHLNRPCISIVSLIFFEQPYCVRRQYLVVE